MPRSVDTEPLELLATALRAHPRIESVRMAGVAVREDRFRLRTDERRPLVDGSSSTSAVHEPLA